MPTSVRRSRQHPPEPKFKHGPGQSDSDAACAAVDGFTVVKLLVVMITVTTARLIDGSRPRRGGVGASFGGRMAWRGALTGQDGIAEAFTHRTAGGLSTGMYP